MLEPVVDLLCCPHPHHGEETLLAREGGALRCPDGHAYDIARQGYVNLLGRAAPRSADTPAMVAAREDFLASGAYDPIRDTLRAWCAGRGAGDHARTGAGPTVVDAEPTVVDAGAGTGWYLAGAVESAGRGLAVDVSVAAARRAARRHGRIGAIVADTWAGLPVRSGVADVVLCVFAPRNMTEFHRLLRPGGDLLVVAPRADHLAGAREELGLMRVEPDKERRLSEAAQGLFEEVEVIELATRRHLGAAHLANLVAMGPNAFHVDAPGLVAQRAPEGLEVTLAVRVHRFRRGEGTTI